MKQPEAALQRATMRYLSAVLRPGFFAFHPANEGKRSVVAGARLKAMGLLPGAYDVMICGESRAWAIELKSATGRVTKAQAAFAAMLDRAGIPNAVCRSLDDVAEFLRGHGLARVRA